MEGDMPASYETRDQEDGASQQPQQNHSTTASTPSSNEKKQKLPDDILFELIDCLVNPIKGEPIRSHEFETILRRCKKSNRTHIPRKETIDLIHTLHNFSQANKLTRDRINGLFWAGSKIAWQVPEPPERRGPQWTECAFKIIGNHQMILHTPYYNHLEALELEQSACMAFFPDFCHRANSWIWGKRPRMTGLEKLTFRFFGAYTFADAILQGFWRKGSDRKEFQTIHLPFARHFAFAFEDIVRSAKEVTIIRHWGVNINLGPLSMSGIDNVYFQDPREHLLSTTLPKISHYTEQEKRIMQRAEKLDRKILQYWAGQDSAIVETRESRGPLNESGEFLTMKTILSATRSDNAAEGCKTDDPFWKMTKACFDKKATDGPIPVNGLISMVLPDV